MSSPRHPKEASLVEGPYRIHVVAEMTGIPEPTLRAWERRYGIPTPERTATGYRLYSLREVEQVRAMKAACERGMSAAEAARWVRSRSEPEPAPEPLPAAPARLDETGAFVGARELLLDAIERLDDEALEARLRHVMFLGNATTILDEVLAPTMDEVGRRWHEGKLSIAHEHFASHRVATALRDLGRLAGGGPGALPVLLAGFADDEHELGLLGLAVRFGAWGLRPIVLGPRTPAGALRNAIDSIDPALVALSVTITPEMARARELVDDYRVACGETPWIVGGPGALPLAELVRARGGLVDPGEPLALRELVNSALEPRRKQPSPTKKGRK